MAAAEPVRVVCVSHGAHNRRLGRLRYAPLRHDPGFEIDLVAPARWHEYRRWIAADPPDPRDVRVHLRPIRWAHAGRAGWYLHHYPGLEPLLVGLRPQVIHLWEEPWSLVALQLVRLRARRFPEAAIVIEVDQNIFKRLPPPFGLIRRYVLGETDWLLGRSRDALGVAERCGYRGGAGLIGYGVDRDLFYPAAHAAARARCGPGRFTVGYVGRLIEEKGLDDLIEAVALTPAPVDLAILGEGPHAAALRRHAARRGLAERVRFLPWCEPAEVAAFMRAVDVLALPTRTTSGVREQFGRVIIEAQACGTPVIGSTSGAIPEVVGAGGWIVPERDPVGLAALLARLSTDAASVTEAGQRGRLQVEQRFSYQAVAEALGHAWHAAREARPRKISS